MSNYRVRFTGDSNSECLVHYGIKGQKWGVRRYQNEDGSYTAAGKERYGSQSDRAIEKKAAREYDKMVKNGEYGNDPELKELYIMDQLDRHRSDKIVPKLTEKAHNGEVLSDKENKALDKAWNRHLNDNFNLRNEYAEIYNSPSKEDQNRLAEIKKKMADNRKAVSDIDYARAESRVNKYKDQIASETDSNWIDPSYRKFSSKEEKAKAEAEYLQRVWESDNVSSSDEKKRDREIGHIVDRVNRLSMDGYSGIPKSERNKALYDYVDDYESFDRYDNWKPKYESSPEWKALQDKRQEIAEKTGLNKAQEALKNTSLSSKNGSYKKWEKALNNLQKVRREYNAEIAKAGINQSEKNITDAFKDKIIKNTLMDLGYEVTPQSISLIEEIIWYD